jgi:hypothetical protein
MTLFAQKPKPPTPSQLIAALIANGGVPYRFGSGLPIAALRGAKRHVYTDFVNRNTPVSFKLPLGYQFLNTPAIGLPAPSQILSRGHRNVAGNPAASLRFIGGIFGAPKPAAGLGQISNAAAGSLLASVPTLQPAGGASSGGALNYLPAGTQLVYSVTFDPGLLAAFNLTVETPTDLVNKISSNVSANSGISVIGTNATGNPLSFQNSFSITVQLNQSYTTAQQVQSVIDSALNAVAGYSVSSSSIAVTNVPSGQSVTTAAGGGTAPIGNVPTSASVANINSAAPSSTQNELLTWVETYGGWVVAGLVAIYAAKKLL